MCLNCPNIPNIPSIPSHRSSHGASHCEGSPFPSSRLRTFPRRCERINQAHMSAPYRFGPVDGGHSSRGGKRTSVDDKTRVFSWIGADPSANLLACLWDESFIFCLRLLCPHSIHNSTVCSSTSSSQALSTLVQLM
jgi:hypothetical protein